MNMIGEKIISRQVVNAIGFIEEELDLSSVEKGIYFISLTSEAGTQTKKISVN